MARRRQKPTTLDVVETLLKAQLKALEELRQEVEGAPEPVPRKSPSQVDMAEAVLTEAGHPLHARELIERIREKYGVTVRRESLVSALLKNVARGRFIKTGKNTFGLPDPQSDRP